MITNPRPSVKTTTTTTVREYDEHDRIVKETVTEIETGGEATYYPAPWPSQPIVTWNA